MECHTSEFKLPGNTKPPCYVLNCLPNAAVKITPSLNWSYSMNCLNKMSFISEMVIQINAHMLFVFTCSY